MLKIVYWKQKKIYIPIIGKDPTDGLDNTAIRADAKYSINFTEQLNKFF